MQLAVLGGGLAIEVLAWRMVAAGRGSVLGLMTGILAAQAIAAAWVRPLWLAGRVPVTVAVVSGLCAGAVLSAATRAVVAVASRLEPLRRHVASPYRDARGVPAAIVFVLAVLVAVPGEELFWRGLAQGRLADATSPGAGAVLAWAAYVGVAASSGRVAFAAAAVVGGAVWGGLAVWTRGVLASLLCHGLWTSLMLLRPPAAATETATVEGRSGP